MISAWCFLPSALCLICALTNVESCENQTLYAPLGSSVLLPCFKEGSSGASWVSNSGEMLVHLRAEGLVTFLDPREGRLKVFPNHGSRWNFSIRIDELKSSDLGLYRCNETDACFVELAEETKSEDTWLLVYICAGLAAFILLSFFYYLIFTYRKQRTTNKPAGAAGASASIHELNLPPVQHQQQEVDSSIYENDGLDLANYLGEPSRTSTPEYAEPEASDDANQTEPTQNEGQLHPELNQFNFERAQSERSKQRFHRELMNRLRQASISRHHYVNQRELRNQQVASATPNPKGHRKKKNKDNCEYKNPIYNRSTEHLNQQ